MKIFENRFPFLKNISAQVALILVIAVLLWATGAPLLLNHVKAASLSQVSDTLSTSNNSSLAKNTIVYTNATSTIAAQTIKIQFDPVGSAFTEVFSSATTTGDITVTGFTQVANAAACSGAASEAYPVGNYNNGTDENITWTVCPSDTIGAGTITITIGAAATKLITNPSGTGSYRIIIGGTQDNSSETRVAILPNVTLTASINTSFTFTLIGTATTTALFGNNATSTITSFNSSLPFMTLASSSAANAATLVQQMNVTTNARNGFSVTIQENQPPTSGAGAIINLFNNGATTSVPISWQSPSSTLDQYNTYSHLGVTSDDADLNTNEFASGAKWAGNIDVPRVVFSHTGPSDGLTQNKGTARVAYRIQIGDLQPAGSDYTNIITYVATPTF